MVTSGETPVSPPAISGPTQVGQQATAIQGSWPDNPTSITEQWYEGVVGSGDSIDGATGLSYTPTEWQLGKTLSLLETAHYADGSEFTAWSAPSGTVTGDLWPYVNVQRPFIVGSPAVGVTLDARMGTWTRGNENIDNWWYAGPTGDDYTAQWQRCTPVCIDVPTPPRWGYDDASLNDGLFYPVTDADLGAMLRIVLSVRYDNGAVQTTAQATSDEIGPVVPADQATQPVLPPTQVIDTALARLRLPRAATTRSLLRAGGFRSRFGAPTAGALVVSWFQVSHGHRLPAVLARAAKRYARQGKAGFEIRLTAAGRRVLRARRRLGVVVRSGFGPSGDPHPTMLDRNLTVRP